MHFSGRPIEVRYSDNLRDTVGNPAHAATFIRQRLVVLDSELLRKPGEHRRILTHELFHFVWVRLGNRKRDGWSEYLATERESRARGEAGWSAEWRKLALKDADARQRTRAWRDYCCESFCDTAALLYANCRNNEVTLAPRYLAKRGAWFDREHPEKSFPI